MAPVLHFVRHGEGVHNLDGGNYDVRDPDLTDHGREQCREVPENILRDQSKVVLVAASPLRRTLETALIVTNPALSEKKHVSQILAVPDAQETTSDPCDTGSDATDLRQLVEDRKWPIDLSLVQNGWHDKSEGTRFGPGAKAIRRRARDLRVLLRQRLRDLASGGDDAEAVLATHGTFLHFLTEDWEDSWSRPGTGWVNCETRSYNFKHDFRSDEDPDALVVETSDSRERRGKTGSTFDEDKQAELYSTAMQKWGEQGLQRPDQIDESS